MFEFLKRKKADFADTLTNQTIGGQSVLYRLFREALKCEESNIRRLELTYLAATVMSYVYLRFGKQSNREEILDQFTRNILTKSLPSAKEKITLDKVVREYQGRYAEYSSFLNLLFSPSESTSGNPAATLLMHAFQCVTQTNAKGHMIYIVSASAVIQQFVLDHIDFVKQKL